jgi:hypothetical protein
VEPDISPSLQASQQSWESWKPLIFHHICIS